MPRAKDRCRAYAPLSRDHADIQYRGLGPRPTYRTHAAGTEKLGVAKREHGVNVRSRVLLINIGDQDLAVLFLVDRGYSRLYLKLPGTLIRVLNTKVNTRDE